MNGKSNTNVLLIVTVLTLFLIVFYWRVELKSKFTIGQLKPFEQYAPKNVFIDLGANKGDSIVNFLGITENAQGGKMSNLIDLSLVKNKDWIIYAVEANPHFNKVLNDLKKQLERDHRVKMHLYNETAAWTKDGFIEFFVDTVNSGNDFWGSSLNKNHPDAIRSGQKSVKVRSIDVARLIKQYDERDLVVVKMDIEGSSVHSHSSFEFIQLNIFKHFLKALNTTFSLILFKKTPFVSLIT
jgi:FkbM family methyltransferase